jgi:hypothetical protein
MKYKSGSNKIVLITTHAKKIYKKGEEKWSSAVKRATLELRKKGVL